MAVDVSATIRKALREIQSERDRLDRQIAALRGALGGASTGPRAPSRRRRGMSAAARRAVGKRMKAYWAKRRATKKNGK